MKSIRDAARLYRTLIAEGLRALADDETLERAGRRADDALWRLGGKIQPRVEGPGLGAGWTDLDGLFERISVEEKPLVDRAIHLRDEVYGPAWAQVGKTFDVGGLKWRDGEVPTISERTKAEQAMRDALPKFEPFDIPAMPGLPDFQSMVNDMVKARNDLFEERFRKTFAAGVDPESEWTYVDRIYLDGLEADSVDPLSDAAWRWITDIPMYPDPDDDMRLRMKTADLLAVPNGDKIVEHLLRDAPSDEG